MLAVVLACKRQSGTLCYNCVNACVQNVSCEAGFVCRPIRQQDTYIGVCLGKRKMLSLLAYWLIDLLITTCKPQDETGRPMDMQSIIGVKYQ